MSVNFIEGMEYTAWFDITKEMVMQFTKFTGDKNNILITNTVFSDDGTVLIKGNSKVKVIEI